MSRVHPELGRVKVTFLNSHTRPDESGYNRERGEAIRSTLPSREVAGSGRRALDTSHRAGSVARPRTIPGSPGAAVWHSAEATCRSLTANGASGARGTRALFETPAALLVHTHGPRAWSWSRGGSAGGLGPPVRDSAIRPSARDVWTPDRATAVLPELRRACRPGCGPRPSDDGAGSAQGAVEGDERWAPAITLQHDETTWRSSGRPSRSATRTAGRTASPLRPEYFSFVARLWRLRCPS